MTREELTKAIRNPMFAKKDSLKEALEYADSLASGAGKDAIAVYTAVYVVLNTLADEIEWMEDNDKVVISWSWGDIESLRPEWDSDKCTEVLKSMQSDIEDSSVARGWEVIECLIDDYDAQPEGGLQVSDKVWWTDPEDDTASGFGTIVHIQHEGDDAVISLKMDDGGESEVLRNEIRFVSRGGE